MTRYLVTLRSRDDRVRASRLLDVAPSGTRVEFKAAKRSLPQNDLMWGLLTDVSRQLPWHSQTLTPNDWKSLFLDALKRELPLVPSLDGDGVVALGTSSSDLTRDEMSNMIELIHSFGANHGVKFAFDQDMPRPVRSVSAEIDHHEKAR